MIYLALSLLLSTVLMAYAIVHASRQLADALELLRQTPATSIYVHDTSGGYESISTGNGYAPSDADGAAASDSLLGGSL